MISAEDARYIVRDLDPEPIVRRAWRAANLETNAVVTLDMATGHLVTHTYGLEQKPPTDPENEITLAWSFACQYAEVERLAALYSEVQPSPEVIEEEGVRASKHKHAIPMLVIEEQLKRFEKAREDK